MFDECRITGEFELNSGAVTPYYYDFDVLDTGHIDAYAYRLWSSLPKDLVSQVAFIAAPTIGGIEIAFSMASLMNKPRVKVCTKTGEVRGRKFSGQYYLIVDDVLSTMQTVGKVKKILGDNICIGAAAFIFRGEKEPDLPIYYLEKKETEIMSQCTATPASYQGK